MCEIQASGDKVGEEDGEEEFAIPLPDLSDSDADADTDAAPAPAPAPVVAERPRDTVLRALDAWLEGSDTPEAPAYHYDMMHDSERNLAYKLAVSEAIQGEDDFVLEIGTGSGLLALLCAEAGCQHVFTAEGDPAVAKAAQKVIEANGREDHVTVLPKFSTALEVAWSADLPCRADVLVAEIFDTGLVGEGVLPSFIDAHRRLLKEDARVVPHRGRIFAAGFRSQRLRAMDVLEGAAYERITGQHRVGGVAPGFAPVFQVQAAALLRRGLVELVTDAVEVLTLEFSSPELLEQEPASAADLRMTSAGPLDGVLMWWQLDMTASGSVQLSTSPLSDGELAPARAHWQQGACVLRDLGAAGRGFASGDIVQLHTRVRGWDLFFSTVAEEGPAAALADPLAFPALPRHHLLELADAVRFEKMTREIASARHGEGEGPILCVSDAFAGIAAALAAADGALVVVLTCLRDTADALSRVFGRRAIIGCYAAEGEGEGDGKLSLESTALKLLRGQQASVVVCEAYDSGLAALGTSWGLEEICLVRERVARLCQVGALATRTCFVPGRLRLVARPFESCELRRRRSPVAEIMSFDLRPFSEHAPLRGAHAVRRSSLVGWAPGWLAAPAPALAVPGSDASAEATGFEFEFASLAAGDCDGLAFWAEDYLELDPLLLPVVGILVPEERAAVRSGTLLRVSLAAANRAIPACTVEALEPGKP